MNDVEMLKALVRFEVDPALFSDDATDDDIFEPEKYKGTYKPTYQDLTVACENMIKAGIDIWTLENWHYSVSGDLGDCYEGGWTPASDLGYLWPNNDFDQFKAMENAFDRMESCEGFYEAAAVMKEGLQEIIKMAENYLFNREHEPINWRLTNSQRMEILEQFSESTGGVSNSRRDLFRRIVDEECENGNYLAMKIKGYGSYGGDKVFDCDWEESRKWITKLFEVDGNPYYANTLGYIYYYGRCNNGVPEYEKAFQYFSVGAAHDVIESMYKLADMFLSGKGCIKAPEASTHIIFKLYDECRSGFCMGKDAKFADVALRMASFFQRKEQYSTALYHYMEADYAIKKRLKKSDFFGDRTVQDKITKSIEEVRGKMERDFFKEEIKTRNPYWLFDMLEGGCNAKFEIVHSGDNRYRLKVIRPKKDGVSKAFVVSPELERITLARIFESEFVTDSEIEYMCADKSNMFVDNITYADENKYYFCNGEKEIFVISDADYILRKTDFDKKST